MTNAVTKRSGISFTLPELVYLIYFAVMFGARAIGLYEGGLIYNLCLVAGLILFGVKVLVSEHTVFEYILIATLIFLSLLIYKNTGEKGILLYFSMMLGMKSVSTKRVMRLGLVILGFSFFILYVLSVTGVINELNHINKRSGFGYILRHSLGYPYPNTTHTTLLILIILFFYLYEYKTVANLITASIFAMLLNILIFIYTISFTGVISVTLYLLLNIYFCLRTKKIENKGASVQSDVSIVSNRSKVEDILITLCFPVTVVFSILGPVLAKGDAFNFLNKLLHKRYEYALYYLQNEKITLFGSRFAPAPTNWYMIDNSYLYLFLQTGIVVFAVVCALYLAWILFLIKENKVRELGIMITFCIIGMSDPFMFNLSYKNITFLMLGAFIYSECEKISLSLPSFLSRKCRLIKAGENEFSFGINIYDAISGCCRFLVNALKKHAIIYGLLFVILTFAGAVFTTHTTKVPQILYIDEKTADPYTSEKREVFLSEKDVEDIIAAGDIIEDYQGEGAPMYFFKKKAPLAEYYRDALSNGLIIGTFLTLISALIPYALQNKREKEKV